MRKPMGNVGPAYLAPPAPPGGTCPLIKLKVGNPTGDPAPLWGPRSTADLAAAEGASLHLGVLEFYKRPFVAVVGGAGRLTLFCAPVVQALSVLGSAGRCRRAPLPPGVEVRVGATDAEPTV